MTNTQDPIRLQGFAKDFTNSIMCEAKNSQMGVFLGTRLSPLLTYFIKLIEGLAGLASC